jgi:hypothetical protein
MFWFKKFRIKARISALQEVIITIDEIVEILNNSKDLTDKGIVIDFNFDVNMKNQLLIMEYYKKGVLDIFGTTHIDSNNVSKEIEVKDYLLQIVTSPELDGEKINSLLGYLSGFKTGINRQIVSLKTEINEN